MLEKYLLIDLLKNPKRGKLLLDGIFFLCSSRKIRRYNLAESEKMEGISGKCGHPFMHKNENKIGNKKLPFLSCIVGDECI